MLTGARPYRQRTAAALSRKRSDSSRSMKPSLPTFTPPKARAYKPKKFKRASHLSLLSKGTKIRLPELKSCKTKGLSVLICCAQGNITKMDTNKREYNTNEQKLMYTTTIAVDIQQRAAPEADTEHVFLKLGSPHNWQPGGARIMTSHKPRWDKTPWNSLRITKGTLTY